MLMIIEGATGKASHFLFAMKSIYSKNVVLINKMYF